MKKILTTLACLFLIVATIAQSKTYEFVKRDSSLYLDLYQPEVPGISNHFCIVFVFGGGFITGTRNADAYVRYAEKLVEHGYTVACIDYRLGLVGANMKGLNAVRSLDRAVQMATEDLFAATKFLLEHAAEFNIDPGKIVLCGSSAGAITVLQGDYELCNRTQLASILPADFHYAGVMSFSGAIYSHNGALKYKEQPAPTFILHGIEDRLVPYKSIRCGKLGFFGAKPIIRRFKKFGYPYQAYRYEGLGHEVAGLMLHDFDACNLFINQFILQKKHQQIDATLYDGSVKPMNWGRMRSGDLY